MRQRWTNFTVWTLYEAAVDQFYCLNVVWGSNGLILMFEDCMREQWTNFIVWRLYEANFIVWRLYEAADIIQKLHLIGQELPEQEFSHARRSIEAKYVEIEKVKSHCQSLSFQRSIHLSIDKSISLRIYPFMYLSIYPSKNPSYLSIYLSVYLKGLIEEFVKHHRSDDKQKMAELALILSHFRWARE